MCKLVNIALATSFLVGGMYGQVTAQQKSTDKKTTAAKPAAKAKAPTASTSGYKKLPGGVDYKIVKDVPGKNAVVGDILEMHILIKADTTVLRSSRKETGGKPVPIPVSVPKMKADFTAVLPFLSVGDSAVVRVSMDSFLAENKGQQFPPEFKKSKKLIFEISIASLKTQDDYQKEMQEGMKQQGTTDDKLIQDYLKSNNINAQKTASGLYYVIRKEGEGALVTKGQKASVNYTGKLLNGKMFDSNTDPSKNHMQPFEFKVGMGQVIPGWDEGFMLLKKGSQATLYIPSPLGYGPRGAGADIPANTVLMFDVEVLDIKSE